MQRSEQSARASCSLRGCGASFRNGDQVRTLSGTGIVAVCGSTTDLGKALHSHCGSGLLWSYKRRIDRIGRLIVPLPEQMRVDFERDVRACMAQPLTDRHHVEPAGD